MNPCLKNLTRIEFAVTDACTGRCKHCQNGDAANGSAHIDVSAAVCAVRDICANYEIDSLMTFGGEPLLYPEVTCAIHKAAYEMAIPHRQLITNGFFTKDKTRTAEAVKAVAESGVNDLLLSVDAFHQETIPTGPVMYFAECAVRAGIPVRLQPAWLVSRDDDNPYNTRTREVLSEFAQLGIAVSEGNVIFKSGNALKYLGEYFRDSAPDNPYEEDPTDVRTVSFSANGDVLGGNIYKSGILEIIRSYRP
jgi:hypothetical protein